MSKNLKDIKKRKKYKNLQKIPKNHIFSKKREIFENIFIFVESKINAILLDFLFEEISDNFTRALQSTPFQNPGGVPWAWHSDSSGSSNI